MSSEREPFTRPFTTDDKKKDLSERIKAGMSKAAEKGVRIGRPLAFCFLEDDDLSGFPRCASKPVIRSLKDIMDFSFEGKTISETASELGISRMTLTRSLRSKGVLEQFKRCGEENRSKGIPLKRDTAQKGCRRRGKRAQKGGGDVRLKREPFGARRGPFRVEMENQDLTLCD